MKINYAILSHSFYIYIFLFLSEINASQNNFLLSHCKVILIDDRKYDTNLRLKSFICIASFQKWGEDPIFSVLIGTA